ncbi:inositol monophosphatase family protein [Streptococcus pantholopis]|uniref:Inositol monophosphatase n=1 Tax=Streptococcus pantholopis TaxID=1811193 RepID=A0A172Q7K7_9STRE|nr:inositol monophosphatase family protein [Streptococcus pantholopis]AND79397.1 inositol monophosphatase [Streptococcus pantholopis]
METKFTFAKTIIREAGQFIRSAMAEKLKIEEKTQFDDLVTNLDKAAQDLLIAKIKSAYPKDNVMAEENGVRHPITDGHVWILDPIDGTVNFIVQGENFAVMIAYYEDGVGRFGLIYDVIKDVLYAGGGQFDVYANDKKMLPYQDKPFNRSLISANSSMFAENVHGIRDLARQTLGVRIYGGAGISMSQVMSGRLLAYFSFIQPWDYAAAFIMGEKLGYQLLTLDGQTPDFKNRQMIMFVPKQKLKAIKQFIK